MRVRAYGRLLNFEIAELMDACGHRKSVRRKESGLFAVNSIWVIMDPPASGGGHEKLGMCRFVMCERPKEGKNAQEPAFFPIYSALP